MIKELAVGLNNKNLNEIITALGGEKNTTVFIQDNNVPPLLASSVRKPFIYIAANPDGVFNAAKIFGNCGLKTITVVSAPEMPVYTDASLSRDTELFAAVNKFASGEANVLVLAASTLFARVPKIKISNVQLTVNTKQNVTELAEVLYNFGYTKVQTVSAAGDFSVRGDVIDFWQEGEENPVRVMFFGNCIEAIKVFNIQTFLSIKKLDSYCIKPVAELANISNDLILKKLDGIKGNRENVGGYENIAATIENITVRAAKGDKLGGVRWLLPLFADFQTVLDAVANITQKIVFARPREIAEILKNAGQQNSIRIKSLIDGGLLLDAHKKMFADANEIIEEFKKFNCFGFQDINSSHNIFPTHQAFTLKTAPVANYFSALSALVPDIVRTVNTFKKTVLVFVGSSVAAENYLKEKNIEFVVSALELVQTGKINIIRRELGCGFELSDCGVVVYSTGDSQNSSATGFNIKSNTASSENNIFQKVKSAFVMPKIGEVVVHEHHGLGRFLGIKKLTLQDAERDYIVLQYDGGALVYLPPEQSALLSNYSGEPARLNRIGGQDFAAAKQRVRRRLRELSFKLSELYSRRMRVKANMYSCDEKSMQEFAAAFPHMLTTDQQKAIEYIDRDMSGAKIMDRLICGDVGFGKTEVAFHAVFRAVMSSFQAAFLCPTTILSVQHYNTAQQRLAPFGVRVEVLNRFKSDSDVKDILSGLAAGEVDLVIGTHRLLSGDVKYKNLGLLVLDEEQRFGVGHKEKIKHLKNNIDVLTLSATPIPRTLNMALIGVRDISVISTPPVNRFPVITYVSEFSETLMLDAISREAARDGQTIILYNDVANIDKFAARLRRLIVGIGAGELRIGIIHGQMNEKRLEETIIALYDKQIDVMIASTIIENGIDISSANTLIVIDADRLGVAQMHQLRGRVGRSNIQAYAYFTYGGSAKQLGAGSTPANAKQSGSGSTPAKELTEIARKRLEAIQSFYASGAGLQIAMKDLHLRGAGNILGANQSGHMEQIGFDAYCKILEEVSRESRGENGTANNDVTESDNSASRETVLDIAMNCFIPHTYIENEDERMKVYVAISQIVTREDSNKIINHLADVYGTVPQEVINIVTIGIIRALAKNKNIRLIKLNKNECLIKFFDRTERLKVPSINNLILYLSKLKE